MNEKFYQTQPVTGRLMGGPDVVAARKSVATEVVEHAAHLAKRAQASAERANQVLQPVMITDGLVDGPVPEGAISSAQKEREYPPMFAELRANLLTIENAINSINYALSRTEL